MPIYEYACGKCGHEFEVEQRITDAPIKTCPACRSRKARRLISRTSFVLKGGGWYSDLYSSAGGGKGKDASSSEGTEKKEKKKSGGGDAGGAGKSGGEKASGSKDKSRASKAA